jgi:hypothetical protein
LPPELTRQLTIWIGETDRTVTYPIGFDGGDPVAYQSEPGPPAKVVLILNAVVTNVVTGTIAFGDIPPPPVPANPKQSYPPKPTMIQYPVGMVPSSSGKIVSVGTINWKYFPYPGFSYSLVSSEVRGNILNLSFVPSELWGVWCAIQDPMLAQPTLSDNTNPCICDGGSCDSQRMPTRRVDLAVNGNAMQGQLTEDMTSLLGSPAAIRLQLVP